MATVTKQMIQDAHSYTITAEYAAAERITPEDATRESYAEFESAPALTDEDIAEGCTRAACRHPSFFTKTEGFGGHQTTWKICYACGSRTIVESN